MTNDIDELTALNLDFVASAQNSDVRRFDEILAPDLDRDWFRGLIKEAGAIDQRFVGI
jgi:hypothetical protein